MTTPEHDDQAAVERDDALLDAAASGAHVDDPAAALLAEIARVVEKPTSGGSAGEGGGRHIRTIWGVTLGVSVALALGSSLGVAAYGQLVPHPGSVAAQSAFVVPDVPSAAPGLGTVTVSVPPAGPSVLFDQQAATASLVTPQLPGVRDESTLWPWLLVREHTIAVPRTTGTHRSDVDSMAPLALHRDGVQPRTYSRPLPSYPSYDAPRYPAPTRTPTIGSYAPRTSAPTPAPSPAPTRASYVPTQPTEPTVAPTTYRSPAPAPSSTAGGRTPATPANSTSASSANSRGSGKAAHGERGAHGGRR